MVLGRDLELKYLNACYEREGSQIIVVYGEKNVGKTSLLREFAADKPCEYYKVRSASEREQRYQWGRELWENEKGYPSFTEIFQFLTKEPGRKKVIIIDEFQYIVKAGESFMSELSAFVNDGFRALDIMVVLCSSSVGWVENGMIMKMGKAAYALSGFLKIKELTCEDMSRYFSGFDRETCIEAYAVLGGIPGLWKQFDDKLDIKENICRNILSKDKVLFEEGRRMVSGELRETGVYNTILASIAAGNYKLNDLYLHTEFSRAKISVYLKNLMELELVEKIFSYDTEGKENAQKGIYRIKNRFVHFYFTFLYPNLSRLEEMTPESFFESYIAPSFKAYVAEHYKEVCMQLMLRWSEEEKLPFAAEKTGKWVGKFGNIDIIVRGKEETIIGLCNFENPLMSYEDYEWLLFCAKKAKLKADYVYLFSVNRFDERLCLEAERNQNIRLITVDEM